MIAAGSPTQTITINDDSVKIDVDAGFRKREDVVKLNVEEDKTTENKKEDIADEKPKVTEVVINSDATVTTNDKEGSNVEGKKASDSKSTNTTADEGESSSNSTSLDNSNSVAASQADKKGKKSKNKAKKGKGTETVTPVAKSNIQICD